MAKRPTAAPSPRAAVPPGEEPIAAQPHAARLAAAGATMSRDPDIAAHEAMYHRFTGLVKWGIVGSIVLVIFLFIAIHPMVTPPTS